MVRVLRKVELSISCEASLRPGFGTDDGFCYTEPSQVRKRRERGKKFASDGLATMKRITQRDEKKKEWI